MRYKKSPIYRTGNKYKNLNKIIPLFPQNIETFHDVFGGSGTVVINAVAKNKKYNEYDQRTYEMIDYIKNDKNIIEEYFYYKNLVYENDKQFFLATRHHYNHISREIKYLWYLSFMCFSNDLRYNDKGEMNSPFGKRLSEEKLLEIKRFDKIEIFNLDFKIYNKTQEYDQLDFVFIDPPYLQSSETNKSIYGNAWDLKQENELLNMCSDLNKNGIKFMITNTLVNKGSENKALLNFIEKEKLRYIVLNETNNANGKQNNDYLEAAIMNYNPPIEQTSLF